MFLTGGGAMSEQTININATQQSCRAVPRFHLIVVVIALLSLTACIPQGEHSVNTELFKNKAEVAERTQQLRPGMTKKSVFETLKIRPERFERMSLHDVQMAVYGNSQVQGSPAQLEAFRKKLAGFEGYALPYRSIKSDGSLGFGTMKVTKTGCDLRLILVFNKDRLLRSSVEGTPIVREVEDKNLIPALIQKGIGFAF